MVIHVTNHHYVCEDLQSLSEGGLVYHGDELGHSRFKQMTPLPEEMVTAWFSKEGYVLRHTGQPTWSSLADSARKPRHFDIPEMEG